VTVAPVTRTVRDIPVEVPLDRADGLPTRCVVNLVDDITTIPKTLVTERISTLSVERMREIAEAVRFALDLSSSLSRQSSRDQRGSIWRRRATRPPS
jgi:mRNA interferase MazF